MFTGNQDVKKVEVRRKDKHTIGFCKQPVVFFIKHNVSFYNNSYYYNNNIKLFTTITAVENSHFKNITKEQKVKDSILFLKLLKAKPRTTLICL